MEISLKIDNFDRLGINDYQASLIMEPDSEVWISEHTLRQITPYERGSRLHTLKTKATEEILKNNLQQIHRIGLYERAISKHTITFKCILKLSMMLSDEKLSIIDNTTYSFADSLTRAKLETSPEQAAEGVRECINNVHDLFVYSFNPNYQEILLPLTKRITCQCLQLDENSTTKGLFERHQHCLSIIMPPSDSPVERKKQTRCISILDTLEDIWSKCDWESVSAAKLPPPEPITPETTAQTELNNYLQQQQTNISNILLAFAKERLVSTQAQALGLEPGKLAMEPQSKDKAEDETVSTVSSTEAVHLQISEANESLPDAPSTPGTETTTSPASESTTLVPSQIPETTDHSLLVQSASASVRPKRKPLVEPRTLTSLSDKISGTTASPTAALEHSMPEQDQVLPTPAWIEAPATISPLTNSQAFHHHVAECADRLHAMYKRKEDILKAYIRDPRNADAFNQAKQVICEGSWISSIFYALLTEAAKKTPGPNNVFRSRLNWLISINAFHLGCEPGDDDSKPKFMTNESARLPDGLIEFHLQPGVQPAVALRSFSTDFNIIDGSSATLLVLYQAMLNYLTEPVFNKLFASKTSPLMDVLPNFFVGSLTRMYDCKARITDYLITEKEPVPLQKGYLVFATNHHDYFARHLTKQEFSTLLVCTSDGEQARLTAPGFFAAYNPKEVCTEIVNQYNSEPITKHIMCQSYWKKIKQKNPLKPGYKPIPQLTVEQLRQDQAGPHLSRPAYIHFDKLEQVQSKEMATLQRTFKAKEATTSMSMEASQIIKKPQVSQQDIQQQRLPTPKTPEEKQTTWYRALPSPALAIRPDSSQTQLVKPVSTMDVRTKAARPEMLSTPLAEAGSAMFETMTREDFIDHILKCVEERQSLCKEQDRLTQAYLDNPDDNEILIKALGIINHGSWNPEKIYDFLIQAVMTPHQALFQKRLEMLVNSGTLHFGQPPENRATARYFMKNTFTHNIDEDFDYTIMPNTAASAALRSFKNEFNFINSYQSLMLILYQAKHDYLKPHVFDLLYTQGLDQKSTFRLVSPNKQKDNPLNFILKKSTSQTIKRGDLVTFRNHLDYKRRHFNDRNMYIIAICTSDQKPPKFTAPDLFENLTEQEINVFLVQLFNREPKTQQMLSDEIWKKVNPTNAPPITANMTVDALLKNRGGLQKDTVHHIDFDILCTIQKKYAAIKKRSSTERSKKQKPSIKTGPQKSKHPEKAQKVETERQAELLHSTLLKSSEEHQSAEELLATIRKKRNTLQTLCTECITSSESKITETVDDIKGLTKQYTEKFKAIPETLNNQLKEVLQTAENTLKTLQLTNMQKKLRSLCQKSKYKPTTEITELAENIRTLMQTMQATGTEIQAHLKNNIEEDLSALEESKANSTLEEPSLNLLEKNKNELQELCRKKSPEIDKIRASVSKVREIRRKIHQMNIEISQDLSNQIFTVFGTAVYIQHSAQLVEMHATLHNLWKDARKNPERIAEIPAAIATIRMLITRLEEQGAQIPEDVHNAIEKDIRDAEKLNR